MSETNLVEIVRTSGQVVESITKQKRELSQIFDHAAGEMDELRIEVDLVDKGKPAGSDGVFGEAVDVIACMIDIMLTVRPDLTEQELYDYLVLKCAKWIRKETEN